MARIFNFSAGPAVLPLPVLEQARSEMLDFQGSGMSIMEMSHRGKTYDAVIKGAEAGLRRLMNISGEYSVLFLPGGASQQFAMIPLNLLRPGGSADYVNTGSWSGKAIKEAKIVGKVNVVWDGKDENYLRAPEAAELSFSPDASYVHICSNETIGGIRFREYPRTPAPLVADMSSDIMSRAIDVDGFGLIYAGAQKNLGPSGLAVVILRKEQAERVPDTVNLFFRYATHMKEPSLYNTPNTWAVYILKLIAEWTEREGGLPAMQKRNEEKAALLYRELDSDAFWKPCAAKKSRSIMNVTWRLGGEELETRFVKEAREAGMDGLKGHRSVGGIRASIYNAFPVEGVEALVEFMKEFKRKNG
ncbi:MAG: 3-phosphoserine/phosphohydroxythreonine transaminase [Planctomycetota bacterium]|jgi:phosphoserine aminotransferase|nr:3-phosphoserine/phosphohydroxythreonine transaminase [Planctomycetota bacterium]